ncbi:hypothetical protein P7K49_029433 [Saguinus oedipus]|uniref:Uncharacterized protein n=1 Tax=Saguinus oedipus TaxID=9490 RepID=A0ABQ9U7Z9_SAGOE|nr:hypothetical protein P7K49_029433 [Saguinus oedipus]
MLLSPLGCDPGPCVALCARCSSSRAAGQAGEVSRNFPPDINIPNEGHAVGGPAWTPDHTFGDFKTERGGEQLPNQGGETLACDSKGGLGWPGGERGEERGGNSMKTEGHGKQLAPRQGQGPKPRQCPCGFQVTDQRPGESGTGISLRKASNTRPATF